MTSRAEELMQACLDGEANASGRAELEAALQRDPALRGEFERLQGMARLLAEVPAADPPAGLQARILAAARALAPAAPQLSRPAAVIGRQPGGTRENAARRDPFGRWFRFIQSEKETLMSEVKKGFLSSTRSRILAGGAVAAVAVVVISTQIAQPTGETAGTIVPAQRYRAAQQPDANVQAGGGATTTTVQPVQSAQSGAANAANNAAANSANAAAANAANNAAANAANNAAANAANMAAMNAANNAAANAANNAAANAANNAAANAANMAAMNAANNAANHAAANAANNAAANAANMAAMNAANNAANHAAANAANNAAANAANMAAMNAANNAANHAAANAANNAAKNAANNAANNAAANAAKNAANATRQ